MRIILLEVLKNEVDTIDIRIPHEEHILSIYLIRFREIVSIYCLGYVYYNLKYLSNYDLEHICMEVQVLSLSKVD